MDKIQGVPCNYCATSPAEVASREINCHAWRSRDKRIDSSRDDFCRPRRFIELRPGYNSTMNKKTFNFGKWKEKGRSRRRISEMPLNRTRTCCEYPVDISCIKLDAPAREFPSEWHFVAPWIILQVYDSVIARNSKRESIEPPIPRKICINFRHPPPPRQIRRQLIAGHLNATPQ